MWLGRLVLGLCREMGSLGGGGRSGADVLLLLPQRLGFKLARNDDLALVPPDLLSFPGNSNLCTSATSDIWHSKLEFFPISPKGSS